ncbi:putative membrane protein [Pseudomonas aeruginosa 39016]|nr:putative membrane protein [Pseudomonas aeruginosa 39016]
MFGRQLDLQCAAGVPIGVVGVGGEESVAIDVAAPPGEPGVRASHLHQAQATVLHDQAQAVANPRLAAGQRRIGDAQRQQLAGGLLDAAVGILQQIIEIAQVGRGRAIGQAQAYVAGVRRQLQRVARRRQAEVLRLLHLPAVGQQVEAHRQAVADLPVLAQLGAPVAIAERLLRQRNVVDSLGQLQGLAALAARRPAEQLGLDRLFALVEDEQAEVGLVTLAEAGRPAPFQVQRLLRAKELLLLADLAVVVDGPCGDPPAGQRVGHAEAEAGLALGVGDQLRLPGGGVDILAARPLQYLDAALAAVRPSGCAGAAGQRHVVADEGQAGAGAHVVAPRMVEELVDAGGDLRLQGIDHLIHHADGQVAGNRFAGEARGQGHGHRLARFVALLVGGDVDLHLGHADLDPGVLEAVVAALGVEHREGQVRRELLAHRDPHAVLGRIELFQAQPVGALGQQGGGLDLVALQGQQCILHRLGEGDQCGGFLAGAVLGLVEHHLDGARHRLHALAAHRVAGGAKELALVVAQLHGIGTGTLEGQREAAVGDRTAVGGAVLQADPLVAARLERGRLFAGIAELDLLAGGAEALRRAQAVARGTALDEDLLAGLDPVGGAVAGEDGQHVATGFLGRRQFDGGAALAVGGQFGAAQFHRELAEILQFVVHHRQLLGAQAQLQARVGHRLAVRIEQDDLALHRLGGLEVRLGQVEGDFEVRLDVFGDAEGAAVGLPAVVEAQLVAAGDGVLRQLEAAIGAALRVEAEVQALQYRAAGVDHAQAHRRAGGGLGLTGVLELAADHLQRDPVARPVQRAVGEGVDLGVVDLAVVIEVLGDEDPTLAVLADHVGALRTGVLEPQQAVGVGIAAAHHAQAVGPQHLGVGHRGAFVLACGPDQQLVAGDLAHRHAVGDEHHGGGAVLADQRLDQVEARLQLAQRDVDIARHDVDELAGGTGQLDVLRRLDGLGVPQRIAELADQRQAGNRRVLRLRVVGRRRGHGVAHLQLRHRLGDLLPRLVGEGALHHPARLAIPVVPEIGQGVRQAFALELSLGQDPVQVLLPLEELQRLFDPVQAHVDPAIGLHAVAPVVAAGRFETDPRFLVGGEAAVGEQEEGFAGHRRVAARLHRVFRLDGGERQQDQGGDRQATAETAQVAHCCGLHWDAIH